MRYVALVALGGSLLVAGCGDDAAAGDVRCNGIGELTPLTSPAVTHHFPIEHDGLNREYRLYVPPDYDGRSPMPLVFNFHGYTSNMDQQILFSDLNSKSMAEADAGRGGFLVAYPNGVGSLRSWNGGFCCGDASINGVDDVGFALEVIEDIADKGCIDRSRIYTTGMSNGGFMSHRLGCEAASTFAAVGSVTGALGILPNQCQPSRPMPIIQLHGTADTLVNYDNAVVPSIEAWAAINGCNDAPTQSFSMGDSVCDTYDGCDDDVEVILCTVDGGGHCWFGQEFCPIGATSTDLVSNDHLWDFFSRYQLAR
jgi:polyhydroxybutyrate depolymerase